MFGKKKIRHFVIMDGSDKEFVQCIRGLTEMHIGKSRIMNILLRRIRIRRLDRSHPTMLVVTVHCTNRPWTELRKVLERDYPEQCVFNVPL